MKTLPIYTFLLLFLLTNHGCEKSSISKVFVGNVKLTSQEEVEAFGKHHYTVIEGDVTIGFDYGLYGQLGPATNINHLDRLESWTEIKGDLILVNNPELENSIGLPNLKKVSSLCVHHNNALSNLEIFSAIEQIESNLFIKSNQKLLTLNGLENLQRIEEDLTISANQSLLNLSGLENITSIGKLSISHNAQLSSCSKLANLQSLNSLSLYFNPQIKELLFLKNIEYLKGSLSIERNHSLLSLKGLETLRRIEGYLGIYRTRLISLEELSNLESINRGISISNNEYLETLDGLEQIENLGRAGLEVNGNPALTSLEALSNLNYVDNRVEFYSNNKLKDFCALKNLATNSEFLNKQHGRIRISNNLYNPSVKDIANDKCKP